MTGPWNFELQTLPKENFLHIETFWDLVKRKRFDELCIRSAGLLYPVWLTLSALCCEASCNKLAVDKFLVVNSFAFKFDVVF